MPTRWTRPVCLRFTEEWNRLPIEVVADHFSLTIGTAKWRAQDLQRQGYPIRRRRRSLNFGTIYPQRSRGVERSRPLAGSVLQPATIYDASGKVIATRDPFTRVQTRVG